MLLDEEPDMALVNIANDGKELLDIIHLQLPDIILLDINMPNINGLSAIRFIKQLNNAIKIIMLIGILIYLVYNIIYYYVGKYNFNKGVNVD